MIITLGSLINNVSCCAQVVSTGLLYSNTVVQQLTWFVINLSVMSILLPHFDSLNSLISCDEAPNSSDKQGTTQVSLTPITAPMMNRKEKRTKEALVSVARWQNLIPHPPPQRNQRERKGSNFAVQRSGAPRAKWLQSKNFATAMRQHWPWSIFSSVILSWSAGSFSQSL